MLRFFNKNKYYYCICFLLFFLLNPIYSQKNQAISQDEIQKTADNISYAVLKTLKNKLGKTKGVKLAPALFYLKEDNKYISTSIGTEIFQKLSYTELFIKHQNVLNLVNLDPIDEAKKAIKRYLNDEAPKNNDELSIYWSNIYANLHPDYIITGSYYIYEDKLYLTEVYLLNKNLIFTPVIDIKPIEIKSLTGKKSPKVERPPKEKYDYILGAGNIGYNFNNTLTGTLFHNWNKLAQQRTISFSFYAAKYRKFKNLNYSLSNWGDRLNKYSFGSISQMSYSIETRLDTNISSNIGNYTDACGIFGFFIPSLQLNLFSIPHYPKEFDLKNFNVSLYLETYPYEFTVQKFGFCHYSSNTYADDYNITESNTNTFSSYFFKSWETGLRIESSMFYINTAFYWRLPSSKKFVQNGDGDYLHGGKYYKQNGYTSFLISLGLNCDFFLKRN